MNITTMSFNAAKDYSMDEVAPLFIGLALPHIVNQEKFLMMVVPFRLNDSRAYFIGSIEPDTHNLNFRIEEFKPEEDLFADLALYKIAIFHDERGTGVDNEAEISM